MSGPRLGALSNNRWSGDIFCFEVNDEQTVSVRFKCHPLSAQYPVPISQHRRVRRLVYFVSTNLIEQILSMKILRALYA